jgi:hypothetical protein
MTAVASPPAKSGEQRLQEAYAEVDKTTLDADVKIAVKALLTIRQAVDWSQAVKKEVGYQVDPAIIKYIRASSAQELPRLVNEVLEKLPFDLIFRSGLGSFAYDLYPKADEASGCRTAWEKALVRVKKETIPLFLISKKFYQDTEEVAP